MGGSIIFGIVLAVAAGVGGWYAPVYYVEPSGGSAWS